MMKALKRWSPATGINKKEVLIIEPSVLVGTMVLPPSKSHAMRWLVLASMDSNPTKIEMSEIGTDTQSMIRCLSQMGIPFEDGVLSGGILQRPNSVLNCANSGTALRFLLAQAATCDFPIMLDGDDSLRARSSLHLIESLGIEVSKGHGSEEAPVLLRGPFSSLEVNIDVSTSSQFHSALLLMAPRTNGFKLTTTGAPVSSRHSDLTWDLCQLTGAIEPGQPWKVECPDVEIPSDASMMAFAMLAGLEVSNRPKVEDSIGHEVLFEGGAVIDLTDANDLICPLAAILALQEGGTITGAAHASLKESNRILRTVELLECFGLKAEAREDGLAVDGQQVPRRPKGIVETHSDHRLQMTAVLLAAKTGGVIDGAGLHMVAWPSYLRQLQESGLDVSVVMVQP
jgi:3-phosphoshikimate 1-carboxyvinyltransferase